MTGKIKKNKVISISLNEQNLQDLKMIQHELGFSGRSEVFRTALRMLITERNERRAMVGKIEGIILVVNGEHTANEISSVHHKFQDLIKTQIHNHLNSERCMNIFVVQGDAKRINEMIDKLSKLENIDYLKFIKS
ncbi:MAG: CopG family ribbon-helix-helix protein [Thermoplasmata archaeon]